MSNQIDDLVAESLAAQRDTYIAQIDSAKKSARDELTAYSDKIFTAERSLDNQFKGFLTGAIAPLYKTENANVGIRDAFGVSEGVVKEDESNTLSPIIILGVLAIAYYIFKGRK